MESPKLALRAFIQDQMTGARSNGRNEIQKIDPMHLFVCVYILNCTQLEATTLYLLNVFSDGILASTLADLSNICTTKSLGILGKSPEINIFGDG